MPDFLQLLRDRTPFLWLNPHATGEANGDFTLDDMLDAEARLARCAPLLAQLFDEAAEAHGIIESPLLPMPSLARQLLPNGGTLLLKADHDLPVAGSIKARGGIYEVLAFAEKLAMDHGLLALGDNYRKLAEPAARTLFAQYTLAVASTGNLGLSIGTMAAALGFRARVHMSFDAKAWKKELLRSRGVEVIEHEGDWTEAIRVGRAETLATPNAHFIDDENSRALFLGYSVAAFRTAAQLRRMGMTPDAEHPLFVYLPCGVGGAPGGIPFGLKTIFGPKAVRCFFAEPTDAPCMTLGLVTGKFNEISVYDIGLTNRTSADGLAVSRPSRLVSQQMDTLLDGCFTVPDDPLVPYQQAIRSLEGLKIEHSSAATFPGPRMVLDSNFCAERGIKPAKVRHLLWTTGGRYLPDPWKSFVY